MDDFLGKPYRMDQLREVLARWLSRTVTRDLDLTGAQIDLERWRERAPNNTADADTAARFLVAAHRATTQLRSLACHRDFASMRETVGSLLQAATRVGHGAFAERARRLSEAVGRAPPDTETVVRATLGLVDLLRKTLDHCTIPAATPCAR